jgi:hypothetical protein
MATAWTAQHDGGVRQAGGESVGVAGEGVDGPDLDRLASVGALGVEPVGHDRARAALDHVEEHPAASRRQSRSPRRSAGSCRREGSRSRRPRRRWWPPPDRGRRFSRRPWHSTQALAAAQEIPDRPQRPPPPSAPTSRQISTPARTVDNPPGSTEPECSVHVAVSPSKSPPRQMRFAQQPAPPLAPRWPSHAPSPAVGRDPSPAPRTPRPPPSPWWSAPTATTPRRFRPVRQPRSRASRPRSSPPHHRRTSPKVLLSHVPRNGTTAGDLRCVGGPYDLNRTTTTPTPRR